MATENQNLKIYSVKRTLLNEDFNMNYIVIAINENEIKEKFNIENDYTMYKENIEYKYIGNYIGELPNRTILLTSMQSKIKIKNN